LEWLSKKLKIKRHFPKTNNLSPIFHPKTIKNQTTPAETIKKDLNRLVFNPWTQKSRPKPTPLAPICLLSAFLISPLKVVHSSYKPKLISQLSLRQQHSQQTKLQPQLKA
jgi:hypothetical protein